MPTKTFQIVETYTTIACPRDGCGVSFAINDAFLDRRVNDHKGFYCPNGHTMSYTHQNEAEKQRERIERLKHLVESRERDIQFEQTRLTAERRAHSATKGKLTKVRKRAAHGVCPCCSRTFANVARHVAGQHPKFLESA